MAPVRRQGTSLKPGPDLRAVVAQDHLLLTLPIPPSINHQYATVNGRRLLSVKGRAYKQLVGQQILVALAHSPHRGTQKQALQTGSLSLSAHFFFASALRRDVDGGLKIVQDALCENLGVNDNRVVEIHLFKRQDREHPRMELHLSIVPPGPAGSMSRPEPPPARATPAWAPLSPFDWSEEP